MRTSLISRHPIAWFCLGVGVSWVLVLLFDLSPDLREAHGRRKSEELLMNAVAAMWLGGLLFAIRGSDKVKGRPWPPVTFYVPFGLGLLHAAPALFAVAVAKLATIQGGLDVVVFLVILAWVLAEPFMAVNLTLRAAEKS